MRARCGYLIKGDPERPCAEPAGHTDKHHRDSAFREKKRERNRKYEQEHREENRERSRKHYQQHREERLEYAFQQNFNPQHRISRMNRQRVRQLSGS